MANEFKIKKGLIVTGADGGTVVDIQGSQGQLFSVTDDLSGSIFAVSDISGVPIFDVNSSGVSHFDGNVGIGTTSPVGKLNVALPADSTGNVASWSSNQVVFTRGGTSTSQGLGFSVHDVNNTATISSLTPAVTWSDLNYRARNHAFYSNGATLGIYQNISGNVGIGTTTPDAKLDIGVNNIITLDDTGSSTGFIGLGSYNDGTKNRAQGASYYGFGIEVDRPNARMSMNSYDSNGIISTSNITLKNNGNVGIGTTSPAAKLQLGNYPSNNIDITTYPNVPSEHMIHITAPETTNRYGGGISFGENAFTAANITVQDAGGNGSLHMLFGTRNTSGTVAERMRITSSGNVGIGKTIPGTELDVDGVVTATGGNSTEWNSAYDYTNGQNNSIQGKWYSGDTHDYVSGVSYYTYTKVAKLAGNTTNASFEYYVKRDYNYPGTVKGSFTISSYAGSSMSVQHDLSTGKGTMSPQVYIDNNRDIWIRFDGAAWVTTMRWRCIYNNGVTIYDGTTRQNTAPSNSALVNPGDSLKFAWNNVSNRTVNSNIFEVYAAKVTDDLIVSGNVGIGTTAPNYKLSVQDSVNNADVGISINNSFDDNLATSNPNAVLFLNAASNNGYLRVHGAPANTASKHQIDLGSTANSSFLTFSPSGSEKMRITSGGNVGIGTDDPDSKLDVAGATITRGNLGFINYATQSEAYYTKIGTNYNYNESFVLEHKTHKLITFSDSNTYGLSLNGAGLIRFMNGSGEKMRISDSGNVGIGTTSPRTKLNVAGTSADGGGVLTLENLTTATGNADYVGKIQFYGNDSGTNAGGVRASIMADVQGYNGETDLVFSTANASSSESEAMRITAGGNVGIGTTSPGRELDVHGNIETTGSLWIGANSSTASEHKIKIGQNRSGNGYAYIDLIGDAGAASNYNLRIIRHNSGANALSQIVHTGTGNFEIKATSTADIILNSPGNIGISNTGPSYKLDVTGNARFTSTVTATNFILSSDERLKENIEKVCDNRVKADWRTFELKTDKGQKRYGVIAQELEKTNPEFVREDSQGFKSVAYIDLLIAKIAELEARLEKLEK